MLIMILNKISRKFGKECDKCEQFQSKDMFDNSMIFGFYGIKQLCGKEFFFFDVYFTAILLNELVFNCLNWYYLCCTDTSVHIVMEMSCWHLECHVAVNGNIIKVPMLSSQWGGVVHHDEAIKWKHFSLCWAFVRAIQQSMVRLVIWDAITPIMTSL